MELGNYDIKPVRKQFNLQMKDTLLLPLGDIQYGAQGVDVDLLEETVGWSVKNGAIYGSMGDMVDVASPSNRQILNAAQVYDSVRDTWELAADRSIAGLLDILKRTKDRWAWFLSGHHYYEFRGGETSDTKLATLLGAPYVGYSTIVTLNFWKGNKKFDSFDIFAHHGVGGGMKAAAPINKLENIAGYFDADVYLMGHYTRMSAAPIPYLRKDDVYSEKTQTSASKLHHKVKLLVCTGGYLKGYFQGFMEGNRIGAGYVEKKLLMPTVLGSPKIWFRVMRKSDGTEYIKHSVEIG